MSATASVAEITRAYRSQAAKLHPDSGGSTPAFRDLEAAYRECIRRARQRPRGRPSRDDFSHPLPATDRRLRRTVLLLILGLVGLACFQPKIALLATAMLGPLMLGGVISQLTAGLALSVAAVVSLGLGLGWLAASYQISWLSYAFATVPSEDGQAFVAAVSSEKQFWFGVALGASALTLITLVGGTLAALARGPR